MKITKFHYFYLQVLISILKMKENDLLEMKCSETTDLFNTISQLPGSLSNAGNFIFFSFYFTAIGV